MLTEYLSLQILGLALLPQMLQDQRVFHLQFQNDIIYFREQQNTSAKQRHHNPTTFRAIKRLQFINSSIIITMSTLHPPPPGVSPPRTTPEILFYI